jgi:branched-chain amino acid transport system permease protein
MTTIAPAVAPRRLPPEWRAVLRLGAIAAIASLYLCLVGIVGRFHERGLVQDMVSLGQAALATTALAAGFLAASRVRGFTSHLAAGALGGALSGLSLSLLVLVGAAVPLRSVLLEASQPLYDLLTFSSGVAGFWLPTLSGAILGLIGGGVYGARPTLRFSLIAGFVSLLILGVFATVIRVPMLASPLSEYSRLLFSSQGGLTVVGAIATLGGAVGFDIGGRLGRRVGAVRGGRVGGVLGGALGAIAGGLIGRSAGSASDQALLVAASSALLGAALGLVAGALMGAAILRIAALGKVSERVDRLPEFQGILVRLGARGVLLLIGLLFVIWLPIGVGDQFAFVVVLVALYILMGLGLNITLGLAGLLDLGFVAFFAVGAYTVGLLTSSGEFGLIVRMGMEPWPFWAAVPFAIVLAMAFGAFLGLPILGIRGDYLAIATLGFGEIVRILAGSDLMKPLLGGPRGITSIPKPIDVPPTDPLAGPVQVYYIALISAAIIAFVAIRLRGSRLGRAWLAIREDEDVAEALGVNLVQTKLLAYILGAAFAGLGGAVFAALIGAAFPSDINLQVSINVAAIIIVGGMGSIPGVVLGAIFLIGLPELFRQFQEFRLLFYGMALMAVMRFRPEGLLPSRSVQRELHAEGDNVAASDAPAGAVVAKLEAEES